MKIKLEVDALKRQWERDPVWDIEETEGFEEHKEELLAYRKEKEAEWKLRAEKHEQKLRSLVCPMSFQFCNNGLEDTGMTWENCRTEQCAWWNEPNECCAIRALNLR